MAQGDLILTVTDVRGESNDKDLPDGIELTGWTFAGNSMWDPNTGQSVGRVKMGELIVTKRVDISSPILIQFMLTRPTTGHRQPPMSTTPLFPSRRL